MPSAASLAEFYRTFAAQKNASYGHMKRGTDPEKYLPIVCHSMSRYFEIIRKIVAGESLATFLDVGGGVGLYAKAAELLGYKSYFVEIDAQAVTFAKTRLLLDRAIQADIQAVGQCLQQSFDIVLARHTIEHLRDPNLFVESLAALVAPGKILILETPNADNWEQWAHPRIFGFYWSILGEENPDVRKISRLIKALAKPLSAATPPKHLYGFGLGNLARLLGRHGFQIRRHITTTCGDPIYDPLYYRFPPFSQRSAVGKAYYLYEKVAARIVGAVGKGSQLIVFAQKT
jgi:2-polyprenyl-3-methyl-5-hydroxy-6-metoxy-1,4-benzoquinol methylase